MKEIVDYTPNDYSPTYRIRRDKDNNFVELISIFNIPPYYPEAIEEKPPEKHYKTYAKKKWEEWKNYIIE